MTSYVFDPENNQPKALVAGTGISLVETSSQITVTTTGGGGTALDGSGINGRVAVWTATYTVLSYGGFVFDGNQLQISATGISGGILLGGDVEIYRSAANVLRTPDSLVVDGSISIGGFALKIDAAFEADPTGAGDGDGLAYNASLGKWKPRSGADILANEIFS